MLFIWDSDLLSVVYPAPALYTKLFTLKLIIHYYLIQLHDLTFTSHLIELSLHPSHL